MEAIMEKYKLWFENYWYHYKYHTLLTLLALITCIVGLSQCSVSEEYDMYVSYAGPKNLYSDDIENGERALESVLDTDFSGDGKVNVSFNRFFYMSPDEVREAKENDPAFSVLDQSVALDSFKREFEAGDTVIWLVSPALYEEYSKKDMWVSMLEVLDADAWRSLTARIPEDSYDQYSVKLCETRFGQVFFSELPEDTLLCMRRKANFAAVMGEEEAFVLYERGVQLMKNIFAYENK
jgi:hypothetical protein